MAYKADNSGATNSILVDGVTSPATGDVQTVKVFDGRAGASNVWNVETDGAARVVADAVSAAALSSVADQATAINLAAANSARRGLWVFNDSTSTLYIKMGSAASLTSFSVKLFAGDFWEMPTRPIYTGVVSGIWDVDSTGSARVTEF